MKDCVGNEIHEGAILKVFHFYGARSRKKFMYKQVGSLRGNYREIHHLPISKDKGFYLRREDSTLNNSVVVSCNCKFHIANDLKISKFHGA